MSEPKVTFKVGDLVCNDVYGVDAMLTFGTVIDVRQDQLDNT